MKIQSAAFEKIACQPVFGGQVSLTICEETGRPEFRYTPQSGGIDVIDAVNWGLTRIEPNLSYYLESLGLQIKDKQVRADGGMDFGIEKSDVGWPLADLESGEADTASTLASAKHFLESALGKVSEHGQTKPSVFAGLFEGAENKTHTVDAIDAISDLRRATHMLRALEIHRSEK